MEDQHFEWDREAGRDLARRCCTAAELACAQGEDFMCWVLDAAFWVLTASRNGEAPVKGWD